MKGDTVLVEDAVKRWGVTMDAVRMYCRANGVEFIRCMVPSSDGHGLVRRAYIEKSAFERLCEKRGQ